MPTPTVCECCGAPATWQARTTEWDSDHYWYDTVYLCDGCKAGAWWIDEGCSMRISPAEKAESTGEHA